MIMTRTAPKVKDVYGIYAATAICTVAFFLRLYQLFFITDENSGLLTEQYATSYIFYAALILAGILLLISAWLHKFADDDLSIDDFFGTNRLITVTAYLLAIALLFRFISLSVLLFDRNGSPVSTDPGFVYPNTVVWMFTLLSSIYYALVGASFSGRNYNLSRFGLLNLAPVLMSVASMFAELIYSVNAVFDIGSVCRMLYTVLCAAFTISFAASADRFTTKHRRRMYFITFCLGLFCGPCVLGSILFTAYTKSFTLMDAHLPCDLFFGIFAGILAICLLRSPQKQPPVQDALPSAQRRHKRKH